MRHIATHERPDVDALTAAWLASRFLFSKERCQLMFVPSDWSPDGGNQFDCVLDVGCNYDVDRPCFDHKPPAVADRHRTRTSRQVWDYLLAEGYVVQHLSDLIDVVHDGDSSRRRGGSEAYRRSCQSSLHAFHEARCQRLPGDRELWRAVRGWLDRYERAHRIESPARHSRWRRYGRGRVYLQVLEAAAQSADFDKHVLKDPHQNKVGFKRWDPNWQIANALASRWHVNRDDVIKDARFAFTVMSVVNHCGNHVRVPILAQQWRLSEREIGQISLRCRSFEHNIPCTAPHSPAMPR